MRDLRARRPRPWPDQSIYLEAACAHFGVGFTLLDEKAGTLVRIGEGARAIVIATVGRTCVYPLNSASAMSVATDKYFTRLALDADMIPNFGGDYFFLDARRKKLRPDGHEIEDARAFMEARGHAAFCKPLAGSRGDFAEKIHGRAAFEDWLSRVASAHDAILIQDIFEGDEFRIFLVDGEPAFAMQRFAPELTGDGVRTLAALHGDLCSKLSGTGVSAPVLKDVVQSSDGRRLAAQDVPPEGARVFLDDRRNASAGALTRLVDAQNLPPELLALSREATAAIGLRVAGVDVMATREGPRIIELNGNPAIASLEAMGRDDMILALWGKVFQTMGFIDAGTPDV